LLRSIKALNILNGEQQKYKSYLQKNPWSYIGRQCKKHNTIATRIEKKYGEVANELFSWALLRQVATCRFHACVYRRKAFIEYLTP